MTRGRTLVLLLLAVSTVFVANRLAGAQETLPDPETQKVILENPLVRVIDVRVAPGVAEALHSHRRGLTIALTEYENETRVPGGQWVKTRAQIGDVKWAEPVTHEARNTGKTAQRVIRVELK